MIELETAGGIWTVTLNRPEKANALSAEMLTRLRDILQSARAEAPAALILTGRGKVFSAGADLDEAKTGLAVSPLWEEVSGAMAAYPGLSIAAMNGTLAGGACGIAMACDIRLGVAGMKVFYPVMRLGYLPRPPDPARLVALVGPSRAKMILLAGQKIEAEEALSWGLIDRLLPAETLLEGARALAGDVVAAKPGHASAIKAMIG